MLGKLDMAPLILAQADLRFTVKETLMPNFMLKALACHIHILNRKRPMDFHWSFCVLCKQFFIIFDCFLNDLNSLILVIKGFNSGLFIFKLLINLEEMHDFIKDM